MFLARGKKDHAGIYLGSLDGRPEKLLIQQDSSAIYSQPGYVLYVDGETLFAHPFDLNTLQLRGQVIALDQGIGRSGTYQTAISSSHTGRIAYGAAMWRQGRLTWHTRTGSASDLVGAEGDWTDFRLSPDQQTLAAGLAERKKGAPDLWLTDLTRGSASRVTFGPGVNAGACWSPDGASILFRKNSRGAADLHLITASGTDSEPALLHEQWIDRLGTNVLVPSDWSADGKHVLMNIPGLGTGYDLWKFAIGGDREVKPFVIAASDQMHGNFSPDSRLVAYSSSESGRFEVVVRTFDSPGGRWQVSTEGGTEPRWRHDGREIYYLSQDHKLMAVSVGPGPSFGVPKALFQTQVAESPTPFRTHYVPSNDGQRFLINDQTSTPPVDAITVVLSLDAVLKKKQ